MKATILLCDAAQASDGKLNMLGAGWNVTGPQAAPFAIALLFDVPWDQAGQPHHFQLSLVDADGRPVRPAGADQPIAVAGDLNVGRPEGVRDGTELRVPIAITFGPLALVTGQRYVWHLEIDGQRDEAWSAPFDVRPG